tara:strand:+ start:4416 stop:5993 length:1578 start_codon:yes stop_codon:yes gene_type:complete
MTINSLNSEQWDLIIIGGGITGAGILREAVRRDLKVLLLEQQDFAWGTSSRSTKWVHGGLKYLEQGKLKLVVESVKERQALLRELPGLVSEFSLMLASYRKDRSTRLLARVGLVIYDIICRRWRKHRFSFNEVIAAVPELRTDDLSCGIMLYESITDDARLVFRLLDEAMDDGGTAINYLKAERLLFTNGSVSGVTAIDSTNGENIDLRSRLVINATGAWADNLRQQVNNDATKYMRPLRGSHLVFSADTIPITQSLSMVHPEDGRLVFAYLWEGRIVAGSTDLDHKGDLNDEAAVSREEVNYILANLHYHFPNLSISEHDIIASFSGVRPVVASGASDPSKESRDHVVWQEDGLMTVTGGKLTTFRVIALDALTHAQDVLGALPNLNSNTPVFSAVKDLELNANQKLSPEQLQRLQGRYGSKAALLLFEALDDELEEIPGTHTLWAELRWAVQQEAVIHLADLLLRRTRIGLLLKEGGKCHFPRIKNICQPLLEWSEDRWHQEEQDYLGVWTRCYSVPYMQIDN